MTKSAALYLALLCAFGLTSVRSMLVSATNPTAGVLSASGSSHPAVSLINFKYFKFFDRDENSDGDKYKREHKDWDGDKGWHKDPPAPVPNPEPSTLLSFGAALLVGGGVLYSRRMLGNRK